MKDLKALREHLRKNPAEMYKLCKYTGLSLKQLKYKLYNPGRITLYEVVKIKDALRLTMDETIKIFAPSVANRNY